MAMLAEPKRKQKFGPDPRNTFWSNDETKFGFRMLENMGWKKGKGLGANEDGRIEHVKSTNRQSTDVRGVGCSKNYAENWLGHQDDFNALLSSLNSEADSSDSPQASNDSAESTAKSLSLEEKSRSSRSRVHYHKFTRGKDLSSRSAQDLDCIFGKRKGQTSEGNSPACQSKTNSDEEDWDQRPSFNSAQAESTDSKQHGVKTIVSSTSVQEYFAKKMAELKLRREGQENVAGTGDPAETEEPAGIPVSDSPEKCKRKKKKNSKQHCEEEEEKECLPLKQNGEAGHGQEEDGSCEEEDSSKSKKKKKKRKKEKECDDQEQMEVTSCVGEENTKHKKKKKKKKKEKLCEDFSGESENTLSTAAVDNVVDDEKQPELEIPKKNGKSKKRILAEELEEKSQDASLNGQCQVEDFEPIRKKKKKKKKVEDNGEESLSSSILRYENDGKERRRKSVSFSIGGNEVFMISPNEKKSAATAMKKLSKKRKREEDTVEEIAPKQIKTDTPKENMCEETNNVEKKSKKKSKRQKQDSSVLEVPATSPRGDSGGADSGKSENGNPKETAGQVQQSQSAPESATQHFTQRESTKGKSPRCSRICEAFVGSNLKDGLGYGNYV